MEMIATMVLTTDKIIAEDVICQGDVIIKKDTKVTDKIIQKLNSFRIMAVNCYEPSDFASSYYEKIKLSKDFAAFKESYNTNLIAYKVAVDSFVYNRVPFRCDDLLNIANALITPKITANLLLTYIDLLVPKDEDLTYAHGLNVALISRFFGRWLNWSQEDIDTLTLCGFIFDVGKKILPQDIIYKQGKLNNMEFDLIKTHPFHAYHLLSKTNLNEHILNAVLQHHERNDGSGYPQGITGNDIDPFARIIAIVDMYEAMTAPRSYRQPMCPYKAIAIFEKDFFQKYDIRFMQTFMHHLTDELIGNRVKLNTGDIGTVVLTNRTSFSKPVVRMDDGTLIDLSQLKQLSIEEIVS